MKLTVAEIERVILYEVMVDCYTEEEANMGWAIYMEENVNFPFEAEYFVKMKSGKNEWRKVSVVNSQTDPSSFDGGEWYVEIELDEFIVSAKLSELRYIKAEEETMRALQVWNHKDRY
ncbi:MAG: calcium-binding protein [Bacteroidota bacterium]